MENKKLKWVCRSSGELQGEKNLMEILKWNLIFLYVYLFLKKMRTLAIETSCDDTSLAIVHNTTGTFEVETILAYSQITEHQKFWGVVPELASRLHSEKIIALLQAIWWEEIKKVDFISVTTQPGLPGSLVVGKTVAYELGAFFDKEVVPVHHISGHIFSVLLERKLEDLVFPLVILTASGGHNDIYLVQEEKNLLAEDLSAFPSFAFAGFSVTKIGQTLDDAAGECFDKVSRMLWGPYPWWVRISQKAELGKKNPLVEFKRIFLAHDRFEFSFSGMKSQVSFLLEKLKKERIALDEQLICDIAYEFQEAVVEVLSKKLVQAGIQFDAKSLAIAGGVSANNRLIQATQKLLEKKLPSVSFFSPAKKLYSTDNGAMIGVVWLLSKRSF